MSAAVIAIILFVFFVVGLAVGVLVVAALSAQRVDRAARRIEPDASPLEWRPYVPETDPDDQEPDEPPWWQTRGGG